MITEFRGDHAFLSNFYPCNIYYNGLHFYSVEAAFQAAKCTSREDARQFCHLNPSQAKALGRTVMLRRDWEQVKVGIMKELLRLKFSKYDLHKMLVATGDEIIQEGNTWNDTFWGVNSKTGLGQNVLGQLLMTLRAELSAE